MAQPPGFVHHLLPNRACKLHRSLCGLKQSPRVWYSRLSQLVRELGFCSSQADHSLFINQDGSHMTFLLVYVDDIIVTGSSSSLINRVMTYLSKQFAMKDLGTVNYFLGIEANLSRGLSSSRFVVPSLINK